MSGREIVERLSKDRVIEKMCEQICRGEDQNDLNDLIQDLYLDLLTKDEGKLQHMYDNGEVEYFIYRMVTNNVYSRTSPYFKKYKLTKLFEKINPYPNDDQADTED